MKNRKKEKPKNPFQVGFSCLDFFFWGGAGVFGANPVLRCNCEILLTLIWLVTLQEQDLDTKSPVI